MIGFAIAALLVALVMVSVQGIMNGPGLATRLAARLRGATVPGVPATTEPRPASSTPVPEGLTLRQRQNFAPIQTLNLRPDGGTGLVGAVAEVNLKTKRPIRKIHGILTVVKVDGTAVGDVQDGMRRLLRSLRLIHSGTPIQTWGNGSGAAGAGQMIFAVSKGWDQTVPLITPVVVGGANTGRYAFSIPISVPGTFYARKHVNESALRIGNDTTWVIEAIGGTVADIFTTPGTGSITTLTLELFAEVDDTLSPAYPTGAFQLFTSPERQAVPAVVQSRESDDLNQNGRILAMAVMQRDADLRSDAFVTRISLILDTTQIIFEGSWNAVTWLMQISSDGQLQVPEVGFGFWDLDPGKNLDGVPAGTSAGWEILVTNIVGAAAGANDGLTEQTMYILPLGQIAA